MMDIRNLSIGLRERYMLEAQKAGVTIPPSISGVDEEERIRIMRPIDLSTGKVVIHLQDMIDTSVALKSNLDVEIIKPTETKLPVYLAATSESRPLAVAGNENEEQAHVAQAIAGLQRDVLLLRNELNFELWHSRENAKHIGRLYEDRILMRTAENERQGLVSILSLFSTLAH